MARFFVIDLSRTLRQFVNVLSICTLLIIAGVAVGKADSVKCGATKPCVTHAGEYFVRMPDGWDGMSRVGAVLYLHPYGGTAREVMKNRDLSRALSKMGLALVVPQGKNKNWSTSTSGSGERNDVKFVDAVLDDLLTRFAVDKNRVIASGYSMGGMLTWFIACKRADRFAGFVAVAGVYWKGEASRCNGGVVNFVHIHGTSDGVVPAPGGRFGGDAYTGLFNLSKTLVSQAPHCRTNTIATGVSVKNLPAAVHLKCNVYDVCGTTRLEVCLHSGGHSLHVEWLLHGVRQVVGAPN